MNNYIKITITLAAIIAFAACQKKDLSPVDLNKVTVQYNTAINGKTFHKGDTITVDADIAYTSELNGVMLQIADSATDEILYLDDQDLHTDHFNLQRKWIDTCSTAATLKIIIKVAVANGTEFAENKIQFNVQP